MNYIGPDMPFYLATLFFAILAYPATNPESFHSRDELVAALNAWRSKNARKRKYLSRNDISQELMKIPNQQIVGRINRASSRVLKRIEAAEILTHVWLSEFADVSVEAGFAKEFTLSFPIVDGRTFWPSKKRRKSLTSIIEEYAASRGMDSSHIKKTLWAESVPVLHLARGFKLALESFAEKSMEINSQVAPVPWDLTIMIMAAEDWVYECVEQAEGTRLWNARDHGIDLSRTIKLTFEKA